MAKKKGPSGLITTNVDCGIANCGVESEKWKPGPKGTALEPFAIAVCSKHFKMSWSDIPGLSLNAKCLDKGIATRGLHDEAD